MLLRRSRALTRFVQQSDLRVVHAHFGPSAAGILPTVRAARIPLVVTFHGFDITRRLNRRDVRDYLYSIRLAGVFTYASKLLAVSNFIADELVAAGCSRTKIVTLYTGVPDTGQPAAVVARRGILFVGRLVEKKGLATLLKAVASLPEPYRSTPVTVVGDGPLRARLEAAGQRQGLRVVFAGHRTPQEVTELMRSHELLCVPSQRAVDGDSEGFGMVFLEAGMNCLPVVSTRHGGISEAVEDGCSGLLVGPNDPTALAGALLRVLSNSEFAADLGANGRRRAVRNFTIERQTRALESIYLEVAGSHAQSLNGSAAPRRCARR
jgi:glycosyltransferase involved in cell wall biosynthesis